MAAGAPARDQPVLVGPAPQGVDADAQELGGLTHPVLGHPDRRISCFYGSYSKKIEYLPQ